MNDKLFAKLAASPAAFRDHLIIDTVNGPKPFGKVLGDHQQRLFKALDPAIIAVSQGKKPIPGRFYVLWTKGAGKDTSLTSAYLWLLAFSPRMIRIYIGAGDQMQAAEPRRVAADFLRLSPGGFLNGILEINNWTIRNKHTQSICEILSSDSKTTPGTRNDVTFINELTCVGEEFAKSMMDNADKMSRGLVVIASNHGFVPSYQWDWWQLAQADKKRWWTDDKKDPAAHIDPAAVAESERRNVGSPSHHARLWRGQWGVQGDALTVQAIEAACVLEGPEECASSDAVYWAGLDASAARDRSSLAIVGQRHGRMFLAALESWSPRRTWLAGMIGSKKRIDLEAIKCSVIDSYKRFGFVTLLADPYELRLMGQQLVNDHGIPFVEYPFTASTLQVMCSTVLEAFNSGRIDIFRHEQLLAGLSRLRLEETSNGSRLRSPRSGGAHDDETTALTLAMTASVLYPATPWGPGGFGFPQSTSDGRSIMVQAPPGVFQSDPHLQNWREGAKPYTGPPRDDAFGSGGDDPQTRGYVPPWGPDW